MCIDPYTYFDEVKLLHTDLGKKGTLKQLTLLESLLAQMYQSYFLSGEIDQEQ